VLTIPYIAGLPEAIRRKGGNVGIKTVFAANDTLKKRLTHVKPKGEKQEKDLVYRILCDCGVKYVGETGRPLEVRMNEHKRNWQKMKREKEEGKEADTISSLLACHAIKQDHQVLWDDVQFLAKEPNERRRKIHEAAAMHLEQEVISQPSCELAALWNPILIVREEKMQIIRERKPKI
jgi:hypothetical protein